MRGKLLSLLAAIALGGCQPKGGGGGAVYPPNPGDVAGTFYDSLQRGLTRQAYQLLGPDWRAAVPYEQFATEFSELRVADYKDLRLEDGAERMAHVKVRVRALPSGGAPRYYENRLTLIRDPATRRWVIALSDSHEINEEVYYG